MGFKNRIDVDFSGIVLKPKYSELLPISMLKKKDLLFLLRTGVIPARYRSFYEELPSARNVKDSAFWANDYENEEDADDVEPRSDVSDEEPREDNEDGEPPRKVAKRKAKKNIPSALKNKKDVVEPTRKIAKPRAKKKVATL